MQTKWKCDFLFGLLFKFYSVHWRIWRYAGHLQDLRTFGRDLALLELVLGWGFRHENVSQTEISQLSVCCEILFRHSWSSEHEPQWLKAYFYASSLFSNISQWLCAGLRVLPKGAWLERLLSRHRRSAEAAAALLTCCVWFAGCFRHRQCHFWYYLLESPKLDIFSRPAHTVGGLIDVVNICTLHIFSGDLIPTVISHTKIVFIMLIAHQI